MKFEVGQKVEFKSVGIDYEGSGKIVKTYPDSPHLYLLKVLNGKCYVAYESNISLPTEEPEELSEITSVAIMENSSDPIRISKVYTRAKVTKGPEGYTIEILPTPKFTIGDLFVISSGKLGKVIGVPEYTNGKYTYEIQWTDGKKNKCQLEDSMIKLEESFK